MVIMDKILIDQDLDLQIRSSARSLARASVLANFFPMMSRESSWSSFALAKWITARAQVDSRDSRESAKDSR